MQWKLQYVWVVAIWEQSLKNCQIELRAYDSYLPVLHASFTLTYNKAFLAGIFFSPAPICTQCSALLSAKPSIVIEPWLRFHL